jgi:hypothetical protein
VDETGGIDLANRAAPKMASAHPAQADHRQAAGHTCLVAALLVCEVQLFPNTGQAQEYGFIQSTTHSSSLKHIEPIQSV